MPIEKPFAVKPLALGTITTGNEKTNRKAEYLGRFDDPGMVWETSGTSNMWVRGNFGSAKEIDFMALLAANATSATTFRLRLGDSQTDVDGASARAVVTSATYTSSGQLGGYGAALNTNGAGLRDGDLGETTATSTFSSSSTAGHWVQIDLGSSQTIADVFVAGAQFAAYLSGSIIEGSDNGSSWTTIQTLPTITIGTLYSYPVGVSYRYIRVRQPASAFLRVSEFYVRTAGFSYDSGTQLIIDPSITRTDGRYHSFWKLPSTAINQWWRIDIASHTGDFRAAALVLGKRIEASDFYNQTGFAFGQDDRGTLDVGRFGVNSKLDGIKMRTLSMEFGWMSDSDRFSRFQELRDRIGTTGICYWCFDGDATAQRQDKQYMGWLRRPMAFQPSTFKQDRFGVQVEILSII